MDSYVYRRMTGYTSDNRGLATINVINPRCLAHLTRGGSNSYNKFSCRRETAKWPRKYSLSKTAHAAGASNAIIPPSFQLISNFTVLISNVIVNTQT